MNYREQTKDANIYKNEYLNGINCIIEKREKDLNQARRNYAKDIFKNPEKYRNDFKAMLGWPLVGYEKTSVPKADFELLSSEKDMSVYRVSFEVLDGLKMTGLLFKKDEKKRPMVIVSHGGLGTPELISGIYGDSANYNDIVERTLKFDVNVFAPQLLLWDKEKYGIDYDRVNIDAKLKRVASSVTAVEVYGITKIIDYFENENYVGNFGMIGLSYGGFYTIFTAAADTRIKSAISCSWFNDRKERAWSDWTWFNSAAMFNDAEIACLVYPRRLCIEVGNNDELFKGEAAKKEFERLMQLCAEVDKDRFDIICFEGAHEFCRDDAPIQRLVNDLI